MDSIKKQLMDMGFNEAKVTRALQCCPEAQTLEQVMEWLIAHEDEIPDTVPGDDKKDVEQTNETETNAAPAKKLTVEEAKRLIAEKRAQRAEEERKKEIEDEKRRRTDGQKIAETRLELQDQERIRLAQQIRKEKLEKERHKKEVLEQINRDREAFKARNDLKTSSSQPISTPKTTPKVVPSSSAIECKIALRFPDGSNLVHKFSPKEQLNSVRLFVQMEKSTQAQVEFFAPPNRKLTEAQMDETLEILGLCPASRLEVRFNQAVWTDLD